MSISLRSRSVRFGIAAAVLGLVAGSAAAVSATAGGGGAARDGGEGPGGAINERLTGYEETPLALSTSGHGTFRAMVTDAGIAYTLTYDELEAPIRQAHIHFGAVGQSGGISAFLCTNLGNGPTGTPSCPAAPGSVSGLVEPGQVFGGAAAQGLAAEEYDELVAAIRRGAAYVNVHSDKYPGGEIRGQIEHGHQGH
jgi:hypothetical protein